jgi:hypothetical protein
MKLRIHDCSIRFRLTRSEVEKLLADGRVESSLQFTPAPDDGLTYALETCASCNTIRAQRTPREICVIVPKGLARTWATTDQVAMEHLQPVGLGAGLQILVEKDFRCLHRDDARQEDNAVDLYPNPTGALK